MSPRLSTTGYAVLGMLALRPATPYELTQQMQRSLDYCWPTSERSLYDQPERLVAAGLATLVDDGGADGRRRYAVTPAGLAALRAWLADASAMPRFQNEPLLRVLYGDLGTVEDLHRVIDDVRVHVADRRERGAAQMAPYLEGAGLFQERAHIVVLVADLVNRILEALDDWAEQAQQITAAWESTQGVGLTDDLRQVLERMLEAARGRERPPGP